MIGNEELVAAQLRLNLHRVLSRTDLLIVMLPACRVGTRRGKTEGNSRAPFASFAVPCHAGSLFQAFVESGAS